MRTRSLIPAALVAAGAAVGWLATAARPTAAVAQPPAGSAAAPPPAKADGAEAGIKAITAEYARAFNAHDAKAAAALWTANGEYDGADGEAVTGRDAIEKSLAAFFRANPKVTAEVRVDRVRPLGRGLASVDGTVVTRLPGDAPAVESRYSALHTLEDGRWLAVSVGEWVPDPATDVTPKQLEWIIGEWAAGGDAGAAVKIVYAWDDDRAFITGKYTVTKGGETISKGTQVIGRNPGGGLRSWMFDSTGTTSDGLWVRDETRWVNEATGVLPDGTEVGSVNVIVPLGPDAFTWQTTERAVDGVKVPGFAPIKVTRVKK